MLSRTLLPITRNTATIISTPIIEAICPTSLGATDGFILRPFLYGGALLGFSGAVLSLVLSEVLVPSPARRPPSR
jgi:hypothetical protein